MHLHHQFIEMDSPKWHTMLFRGKMYSHFLLFLRIYLYTLLPISWLVLNWKVSSKRFKVCNILFLFPMSRKKSLFGTFCQAQILKLGKVFLDVLESWYQQKCVSFHLLLQRFSIFFGGKKENLFQKLTVLKIDQFLVCLLSCESLDVWNEILVLKLCQVIIFFMF